MSRKLKLISVFCIILSLLFSNSTGIIFADTIEQATTEEESNVEELKFGNTSDNILDGGSMAYYNENKFYYIDEDGLHYCDCISDKDSVLSKNISVDCSNLNVFETKAYYTENSSNGASVLKSIDLNSLTIDTITEFKSSVDYLYVVNQQYATFLMEGVVYNYFFESKETETISTQKNITFFIPTTYGNLFSTGTAEKTIYANDKLVLSKVTSFYDDIGFLVFTRAEDDYQVALESLFSGSFVESEDVESYSLYDEYDTNEFFDNIDYNNCGSKVGTKEIPETIDENSSTAKPVDSVDTDEVISSKSFSPKTAVMASYSKRGYELTKDQKKIVDRAYKMYNTKWVAQKTIAGWRGETKFIKGRTYRIPYGQPVYAGKYIGFSCSLDDFVKYTKDKNSKMYTKKSTFEGGKTSTYYANDCSSFVSYSWGISKQTTGTIDNTAVSYGKSTSKLRIGDCLNLSGKHVVLITNIIKKRNNASDIVEIIEQTPPMLKRSTCTKAELTRKYLNKGYTIYRHRGIKVSNNVAGKEKALKATFKVMANSKELKNKPSESGKLTRKLLKGSTVTVTGYLYNSVGNLWYKTSKGDYIFHSYLNATSKGKVPSNYINEKYLVDKTTGVLKTTPYSAGKTVKKLSKGTIVTVINYVKNSQGKKWYYTSSGNVYSSSLRKIKPLKDTFNVMCSYRNANKLPYKDSTKTRKITKGNSVTVTGYLYNSVGNVWYLTTKGDYISIGYLDTPSVGKTPSDYVNKDFVVDTTKCVIKSTPYSAGTTIKKLSKGTVVKVSTYVKNSYGHKWYRTSEGFIYSGYLTKLKEVSK